jgi:catechol 2,3-dioxygenase-like lactoylglutathione lyase family enzyme
MNKMPLITESNITVMVRDLDASIRFYESIGLTLKQRWENHYAMVETAGITIGLHPATGSIEGSGSLSVGFMVDSSADAGELLEKHGIPFTSDAGKFGIYLHFRDPDGTNLYFVEPRWR